MGMRFPTLLSLAGGAILMALVAAPSLAAQSAALPRTIQLVHCDQQEYSSANWGYLVDFVSEATARNVKVSVEFGTRWAEAVIADPLKQIVVASWLSDGHAVGVHHHDVSHPYWDGYTDRISAWSGNPSFRGTMTDFKDLMDRMAARVGNPDGAVHFGGLDGSITYEQPYDMPWGTDGCLAVGCAVSRPTFRVVNKYGVWFLGHTYLGAFDSAKLVSLKGIYLSASDPDVFGFTFHVQDYADDSSQYLDWLDFLSRADPTGASSYTVPEILELEGLPFEGSTSSLSVTAGGVVDFQIRTDASLAGHAYQILMSGSGSAPGELLGGPAYDDMVRVGLNFDALTIWGQSWVSAPYLTGFTGTLNASGGATATFDTGGPLPVTVASSQILFVALVRDPVTYEITFSSMAWPVDLVP